MYADAHQTAIEQIASIVATNGIDCDLERTAAFTYTEDPERLSDIEAEVEAAVALGLPAAFTTDVPLPYPVQAAVRFDRQAQFHPRRYCVALASLITARGGRVYELSRAHAIEKTDTGYAVGTATGTVRAGHVVVATLLPFHDPGGFFAKTHPSRSYALATSTAAGALTGCS